LSQPTGKEYTNQNKKEDKDGEQMRKRTAGGEDTTKPGNLKDYQVSEE
jgi:hypothetical protein